MKKLFTAALSSLIVLVAHAQPLLKEIKDSELTARIQANQPAKVTAVYQSEIEGIFEVHTQERQTFYTDSKGTFFFINAQLVDFKTRTNFTQDRKTLTNVIPWESLPHTASFTVKKGNGENKIAVFTDPDCPYCRRFEDDLKKLDNITISYFMLPIDTIHPEARKKAAVVLCSADKGMAWDQLMSKQIIDLNAPTCFAPIDDVSRFAKQHQINGTPTIINGKGHLIAGAPKFDRLQQFVNAK